MFKRVDRRRKRKEIEESLGLDEDEAEVFGLHDTDSSESESESDSSQSASDSPSSGTSSDGHGTQSRKKRKRGAPPTFFDESDRDEDGEPTIDDEEDEEGGSDHSSHPPLTIAFALKEPIRLVCAEPEGWECALCPGKVLKHTAMVKVHETSRIHRQRFKRIQDLAMEFSPDDDIQTVLAKSTETQPKADNTTLSRRAEERKAKQAKLKERRKKFKERKAIGIAMVKAKKAAKTGEKETTAGHSSDADEATQASKRLKTASSESPKGIKNMHRTFSPAEAKILIKGGRKNKKEITKIPPPGEGKRKS